VSAWLESVLETGSNAAVTLLDRCEASVTWQQMLLGFSKYGVDNGCLGSAQLTTSTQCEGEI
jgi:hypothetical protein